MTLPPGWYVSCGTFAKSARGVSSCIDERGEEGRRVPSSQNSTGRRRFSIFGPNQIVNYVTWRIGSFALDFSRRFASYCVIRDLDFSEVTDEVVL